MKWRSPQEEGLLAAGIRPRRVPLAAGALFASFAGFARCREAGRKGASPLPFCFMKLKKKLNIVRSPKKRSYLYLSKDAKDTKLVCMEHKNRVRRRWGLPLALCLLVLLAVVSAYTITSYIPCGPAAC